MNPAEQKAHTRATEGLRRDLGRLEDALTERTIQMEQTVKNDLHRLRAEIAQLRRWLEDEGTHRLQLEVNVCKADDHLRELLAFTENARGKFQVRGFWSRLNWLLTGR